ncbi:toll/interleukin-1 receptor domain-containing protein [Actinosynnema sp. NPDC059797]
MADVFVSYAREDQGFVRKLVGRLSLRGRESWVDWQDILPTADWMREISAAIDATGVFVFVVSPDSAASEVCRAELELAVEAGKRIVPVLRRDVPAEDVPPAVAGLNWVLFRAEDDFADALDSLLVALEVDVGWVRFHTRLLVRAGEWRDHDRDESYLLVGSELEEVRKSLATAAGREPRITPLQTAYVAESEAVDLVAHRRRVRGFYVMSIAAGALQVVLIYGVAFDEISETGLLALAPGWITSLAFGGSGLLMNRPTPLKMTGAAVAAVVIAYLFYATVWPTL